VLQASGGPPVTTGGYLAYNNAVMLPPQRSQRCEWRSIFAQIRYRHPTLPDER